MTAALLLALGVTVDLICCVGLVRSRNALDRLHFVGPAAGLAPLLMAAAIVVLHPLSASTLKIALIGLVMLLTAPVVTHATARCVFIRSGARRPAGGEEPA